MAKTNTVLTESIKMTPKENLSQSYDMTLTTSQSRPCLKYIWHVIHRDKLIGRVANIPRVVKANSFTSYTTDADFA